MDEKKKKKNHHQTGPEKVDSESSLETFAEENPIALGGRKTREGD